MISRALTASSSLPRLVNQSGLSGKKGLITKNKAPGNA